MRQLGSMQNLQRLVGSVAAGTDTKLIFRSQVTPEMEFPLGPLLTGGSVPTTSAPNFWLNLIKPEIEVSIAGIKRPYHPYGKPVNNFYIYILGGVGIAGIVSLLTAYRLCSNKVGCKTTKKKKK